jgi:hypothetical protein
MLVVVRHQIARFLIMECFDHLPTKYPLPKFFYSVNCYW